jgi:hypothetical protein
VACPTPIPVAARSKAWVCGRSLAGIAVSNPAGGMDVCLSLVHVVCCQVKVSASGWSLVRRSPTEYEVSERDREALAHYGLLRQWREKNWPIAAARMLRRPATWRGLRVSWRRGVNISSIISRMAINPYVCRSHDFLLIKTKKYKLYYYYPTNALNITGS